MNTMKILYKVCYVMIYLDFILLFIKKISYINIDHMMKRVFYCCRTGKDVK